MSERSEGQEPRILVVCYGNLCRSPMAEGLLRRRLPAADVLSAGTNAIGGDRAMPNAVEAMSRREEIDISEHRSRPLTVEILERSDHVLTMSAQQAHLAAALVPAARDRIRLLGAFTPSESRGGAADPGAGPADPLEIADPIAGTFHDFTVCLARLRQATDRFATWLESGAAPDDAPPAVGNERWPFRTGV